MLSRQRLWLLVVVLEHSNPCLFLLLASAHHLRRWSISASLQCLWRRRRRIWVPRPDLGWSCWPICPIDNARLVRRVVRDGGRFHELWVLESTRPNTRAALYCCPLLKTKVRTERATENDRTKHSYDYLPIELSKGAGQSDRRSDGKQKKDDQQTR